MSFIVLFVMFLFFFFFSSRRRHTRSYGDWSSDVCSSDLEIERAHVLGVSLGGTIAQELILAAPERVRSLALGSTWAGPSEWRSRLRKMQLGILESEGVEALVRARVLFIFSPSMFEKAPQMMAL